MKPFYFLKLSTSTLIAFPLMAFAIGGVDVGNLKDGNIPDTGVLLSYNDQWQADANPAFIKIKSKSGSTVTAQRAKITDLVAPTGPSLQGYLQGREPSSKWELVEFNGMTGVRSDVSTSKAEKTTKLYLVSETKDFVQISAHFKNNAKDLKEGEAILLSARLKYRGVAFKNSPVRTVTLNHYGSFAEDYFPPEEYSPGRRVGMSFPGEDNVLKIGTAGSDSGRIVDFGIDSEVPFDRIRIKGKYLEAPRGRIPLNDIYTVFNPKDPRKEQNQMRLKEGHVYLIRTVSWPEEDMITKMRVDRLRGKDRVITYQKLVYVEPKDLEEQVNRLIEYSRKYEQPLKEGEVTLYNRVNWGNYPHSSFNFQFSNSGNVYITHNHWDLRFESYLGDQSRGLIASHSGGEVSALIPMGAKNLQQITREDFPKSFVGLSNIGPIQVGEVYGIYHKLYDDTEIATIYGAVKVLELAADNSWVRLRFRRIALGPAEPMQDWEEQWIDPTVKQFEFNTDNCPLTYLCPLEENSPLEVYLGTDHWHNFMVDSRPFGKKRGLYQLQPVKDLSEYTLDELESIKGPFSRSVREAKVGEVYLAHIEDYEQKLILVFKVEEYTPNEHMKLSVRRLKSLKAKK